jgi:hypothetical protein
MKLLATLLLAGLLAPATHANDNWLWTDPANGAERNAYGPGIHADSFGRAYRDTPADAWVFEPVRPNGYGLGTDSDALGRPVVPNYDLP